MGQDIQFLTAEQIIRNLPGGVSPKYRLLSFALDTARTDEEINISGLFLAVWDATDLSTEITLKFNNRDAHGVVGKKGSRFIYPITRFFLTHTAQASKTIDLIVSASAELAGFFGAEVPQDIDTVGTITNPVDVSDRNARLVGQVRTFVNSQFTNHGRDWGVQAAPVAAATVVTTGNLGNATWRITWGAITDTATDNYVLEHLNAADAVLKTMPIGRPGSAWLGNEFDISLAANEEIRLRVTAGQAGNYVGFLAWKQIAGPS